MRYNLENMVVAFCENVGKENGIHSDIYIAYSRIDNSIVAFGTCKEDFDNIMALSTNLKFKASTPLKLLINMEISKNKSYTVGEKKAIMYMITANFIHTAEPDNWYKLEKRMINAIYNIRYANVNASFTYEDFFKPYNLLKEIEYDDIKCEI